MPSGGLRTFLICSVLAAVTIAAYWPVFSCGFVSFDDNEYVFENSHVRRGLTLEGVKWAFTSSHSYNWHPLTWISHMLDCEFFNLNAGLHHATNLLFHTANTVLLFLVLAAMTGGIWPGTFVAAAFALHPLHVESVAWIAERKDVLSTFFWLLTMAAYLGYARRGGWGRYLLVLVVFAFGLMAKPMLVTLPFVLLLLDYWPLGRLAAAAQRHKGTKAQSGRDWHLFLRGKKILVPFTTAVGSSQAVGFPVWEKLPLFVLAAVSCAVTYLVQQAAGSVARFEQVSLWFRLSNALVSYVAYIIKMVYPANLAVLYPLPASIPAWKPVLAFVLLAAATALVLFKAPRRRYLAVGWLWYLGTLVPLIGLVQVGSQAMADRYTYVPLTGLFIIVAWLAEDFRLAHAKVRSVLIAAALLLLAGMFAGTRNQLVYWKDGISLARRAIDVTENNTIMHNNLGAALAAEGRIDEAISNYRSAIAIDSDNVDAHYNLGNALKKAGRQDEAISHYRSALRIDPNNAKVHNNLGAALAAVGRQNEAISHYRRALRLNPDNSYAYYNLGNALMAIGRQDEAIGNYNSALRIDPACGEAHYGLGVALAAQGRTDEAVGHFQRALQINPQDAKAHNNLGIALVATGRKDEAMSHFMHAVRIDPDYAKAHFNLGIALSEKGEFVQAIEHFDKGLSIDPDVPGVHIRLGRALEAAGKPEEAEKHYRLAEELWKNK